MHRLVYILCVCLCVCSCIEVVCKMWRKYTVCVCACVCDWNGIVYISYTLIPTMKYNNNVHSPLSSMIRPDALLACGTQNYSHCCVCVCVSLLQT